MTDKKLWVRWQVIDPCRQCVSSCICCNQPDYHPILSQLSWTFWAHLQGCEHWDSLFPGLNPCWQVTALSNRPSKRDDSCLLWPSIAKFANRARRNSWASSWLPLRRHLYNLFTLRVVFTGSIMVLLLTKQKDRKLLASGALLGSAVSFLHKTVSSPVSHLHVSYLSYFPLIFSYVALSACHRSPICWK